MADLDRLLRDFETAYRSGQEADPRPFLEQVEGEERERLREMIEAFLEEEPLREWDAHAFPTSRAAQALEGLDTTLAGVSGSWPMVLPRLRHAAQLKRAEVVDQLAAALGHPDRSAKVADYYHQMERGLLPAGGVSSRVLEALGKIIGASADYLRRAGEQVLPSSGPQDPGAVFARQVVLDDADAVAEPEAAFAHKLPEAPAEPDEIDELFTGGAR